MFAGKALVPARKTLQIADARTEICLEKWVGERKYTNPDSTLEDVADDIGVSTLQLAYYFKIVLGQSFQTWRKKKENQRCPGANRPKSGKVHSVHRLFGGHNGQV